MSIRIIKSFHPGLPGFRIMIPLLCVLAISSISCKKFLASYSQNQAFIEKATDLDEILIGEGYAGGISSDFQHIMDDDAEIAKSDLTRYWVLNTTGFHYWQSNPNMNSEGKEFGLDGFYAKTYKQIATINVVLHNAPLLRAKGEPADTLQRIVGEAYFLRAFYYFVLVNVYGKPFTPNTAANDFGVPLKTDPAVEDRFFSRSAVKKVYDQILLDLLEAETALKGFNQSSPIRPNQAAVHALLSRVYLYMEDYEKAVAYANKVIDNPRYQIVDLNKYVAGTDVITRSSPEVVFTMGLPVVPSLADIYLGYYFGDMYLLSDDLSSIYTTKDLRLKAFLFTTSKGDLKIAKKRKQFPNIITDVSDRWLLRLSELYLNKSEALAMLGRDAEAIEALQVLRKLRFKEDDLTNITGSGEALVNFVRDERRRELCFEGHRWFDLRRYAVNSKYPFSKTIRHVSYAFTGSGYAQNGYYELKPYDQDKAAYIVPIIREEIEFNNGLLTNEQRPARPITQ